MIVVVKILFFLAVSLKLAGLSCGLWKTVYFKCVYYDSRLNRSHRKSLRKKVMLFSLAKRRLKGALRIVFEI